MNPEWNQTVIYKNIHLEQVLYRMTLTHTYTRKLSLCLACAVTVCAVGTLGEVDVLLGFCPHVLSPRLFSPSLCNLLSALPRLKLTTIISALTQSEHRQPNCVSF